MGGPFGAHRPNRPLDGGITAYLHRRLTTLENDLRDARRENAELVAVLLTVRALPDLDEQTYRVVDAVLAYYPRRMTDDHA